MPMAWWRWHLARATGWTLEYVDGLSMGDWHEYWQIVDGEGKAARERRQPPPAPPRQRRR
jgi:hypothetical protein